MKINPILSTEFDIELSDEEVSRLERETLRASVKMTTRNGRKVDRDFEITKGEIPKHQGSLNLESFPENADFINIEKYRITVSDYGYDVLVETGYVCDRMGFGRVNLRTRNAGTGI